MLEKYLGLVVRNNIVESIQIHGPCAVTKMFDDITHSLQLVIGSLFQQMTNSLATSYKCQMETLKIGSYILLVFNFLTNAMTHRSLSRCFSGNVSRLKIQNLYCQFEHDINK